MNLRRVSLTPYGVDPLQGFGIRQPSHHTPSGAQVKSRWDWVKEGWTVGPVVVGLVEVLKNLLLSPNDP